MGKKKLTLMRRDEVNSSRRHTCFGYLLTVGNSMRHFTFLFGSLCFFDVLNFLFFCRLDFIKNFRNKITKSAKKKIFKKKNFRDKIV